jgi:hypothetical protein
MKDSYCENPCPGASVHSPEMLGCSSCKMMRAYATSVSFEVQQEYLQIGNSQYHDQNGTPTVTVPPPPPTILPAIAPEDPNTSRPLLGK